MDQGVHILSGLMLSRAGLDRWCRHAGWVAPLAAVAPDVDLVSALGGTLTYVRYHRGPTHSLAMLPVMALLPVILVWLFARRNLEWRRAYPVALVGVASHLLLDGTNVYGVRYLLPFSGEWIGLEIANVVDLWIWAVLLVAAAAPFLSRMVSSEIGARGGSGRGAAVFALAAITVYLFGCYLLHQRATAVLEAHLHDGATPVRVAALPSPANPFRWRGVVETDTFFLVNKVNLLSDFDPNGGLVYYKPEPSPALESAQGIRSFQDFMHYSPFLLWRVERLPEPEGGTKVQAMDLRFGTPEAPRFVMTAILDEKLQPKGTWFQFSPAQARRGRGSR